ncbi:hypothetical protein ACQYWY_21915 [Comamonas sediminis]|uniref:hypothetical protein n=1 Tax=Comamonas sediminis TaxID=1783360 RepID=UPI003D29CABF
MRNNLEKFRQDLEKLSKLGRQLLESMYHTCYPKQYLEQMEKIHGEKLTQALKKLPDFNSEYQTWYSESISLLKQVLPDRVDDFKRQYQKEKTRKEVDYESYRIEDYLIDLQITRNGQVIVGKDAAVSKYEQQLSILNAAAARFESSLFDITQLVQADLLDSEIEAAEVLAKHKYLRAAGAVAGVVIEKHLSLVCSNHQLKLSKKNPSIADFNEALKLSGVIDTPQWRFNQHLADIRNLCDHAKEEPTAEQVKDLLAGTKKIIKTIF